METKFVANPHAGRKFTFLTVLPVDAKIVIYSTTSRSRYVLVKCDCGVEKYVQTSSLTSGDTISCGCALGKAHKVAALQGQGATHGKSDTRTYSIWKGMRKRCLNPNEVAYKHYGERGIVICDRWSDFALFLQDMGEAPEGYSIERIDVNGNYEPSNCKWIPRNEQPLNRTYNKTVVLDGENLLFSHALQVLGVAKAAGNNYRVRNGLTHQETLNHYTRIRVAEVA